MTQLQEGIHLLRVIFGSEDTCETLAVVLMTKTCGYESLHEECCLHLLPKQKTGVVECSENSVMLDRDTDIQQIV